ncbi:MAG: phosphatidate cytidylyltransferase [Gemmatimonadales bacterium]|nr:MAG: phosphatidate cytidylyltransferase [Gemmatimonadales bacterium]
MPAARATLRPRDISRLLTAAGREADRREASPPPQPKKSDLPTRLLVSAVGIPLGFLVVWSGGWVLLLTLLFLAVVGTHEVLGFARARGVQPFAALALPAAGLLLLSTILSGGTVQGWSYPALGIVTGSALLALAAAVFLRGPEGNPLAAAAVTVLAPLYVAVPLAFGWFLRHHPAADWSAPGWAGTGLVLLPIIATWLGDTTAYFGGRAMGRRKLLPSVSPAKTVEGAFCGLGGAVAGALLVVGVFFPLMGGAEPLSLGAAAVLGLIIGAVAQVGDLAESALKREAGIKDSGSILPGHGGVLDRFDAILFTLPLTWLLLPFFLANGL